MPGKFHILVVDDDPTIRMLLRDMLEANGHRVDDVGDVKSAVEALAHADYEVVLTDLMLPDGDGLEVLRVARARPGEPEVLVVTAFGTISSAVEAVRAGAYDYLTKPVALQNLLLAVERAAERRTLKREVSSLRREVGGKYSAGNIVAASAPMRRVMDLVEMVAATDSPVLVQGESGTGKELVARAVHFRGARAQRRFLAVNCAALPEALLESELFGHAKGAFSGAAAEHKGLFEEADGGSLLLDEIGDMAVALQAKLLRVLQEGEVRRVGSTAVRRVDVRIIASTNQDLAALIRQGRFREDLYYRLSVIPIVVPPLRERPDDIVPLCRHFLSLHGARMDRRDRALSPEAIEAVLAHRWPGNIRELENVITRALTLSPSAVISGQEMRAVLALGAAPARPEQAAPPAPAAAVTPLRATPEEEKEAILQALAAASGNQTNAARALGIGRNTLWRKMKKHGIQGS